LKGSTGAIRDICNLANSSIVLSCGLDRYLRVFNYKTYEDMPQIYTKTKLNVLYPLEYEIEENNEENLDEEAEMFEDEDLEEEELEEEEGLDEEEDIEDSN
jgi:hypothetical protein